MTPVTIGRGPLAVAAPLATVVTVERDGSPMLRIDLHETAPACHAFQDAQEWSDFVVIGFGGHVHLVSLTTLAVKTIALSGYFGHLYALPECLLVADADRLHRVDPSGSVVWESAARDNVVSWASSFSSPLAR